MEWRDAFSDSAIFVPIPIPIPVSVAARTCSLAPRQACLVCGYVGCSRVQYGETSTADTTAKKGQHALAHWQRTGRLHGFALHLDSQNVWDYNLDWYCHRVRSEPARLQHSSGPSPGKQGAVARAVSLDAQGDLQKLVDDGKREATGVEYAELLSGQLESQQQYFSDAIAKVECEAAARVSALEVSLAATIAEGRALDDAVADREAELASLQQATADTFGEFSAAIKALQAQRRVVAEQQALHEAHRKKVATIKVENALSVQQQQKVSQREPERARESQREPERDTKRHTETHRDTQRETHRERMREKECSARPPCPCPPGPQRRCPFFTIPPFFGAQEIMMLEDQINDFNRHLLQRDEISVASEEVRKELQEGSIVVQAPTPPATPSRRSPSKGKKGKKK